MSPQNHRNRPRWTTLHTLSEPITWAFKTGSVRTVGLPNRTASASIPPAGHAIEALGDVDPFHFQPSRASRLDPQRLASITEPVLGEFITVSRDVKKHRKPLQPRLVEGDQALAVGPVPKIVHRAEFDQGNPSPRLAVHDLDGERSRGLRDQQ